MEFLLKSHVSDCSSDINGHEHPGIRFVAAPVFLKVNILFWGTKKELLTKLFLVGVSLADYLHENVAVGHLLEIFNIKTDTITDRFVA